MRNVPLFCISGPHMELSETGFLRILENFRVENPRGAPCHLLSPALCWGHPDVPRGAAKCSPDAK